MLLSRFQRDDLLAVLLSQIEGSGGSGIKRVPSYVAPDLAADIRRHFASTLRQRKGNFPCHYITEFPIFTLPAGNFNTESKHKALIFFLCLLFRG